MNQSRKLIQSKNVPILTINNNKTMFVGIDAKAPPTARRWKINEFFRILPTEFESPRKTALSGENRHFAYSDQLMEKETFWFDWAETVSWLFHCFDPITVHPPPPPQSIPLESMMLTIRKLYGVVLLNYCETWSNPTPLLFYLTIFRF